MKLQILPVVAVGLALLAGGCSRRTDERVEHRHDIALALDFQSIDAKVPANATLETLLRRPEFSPELTGSLLQSIASVFNPRSLRANQDYRITLTLDGFFREFRYQIDADRLLRVVAQPIAGVLSAPPQLTAKVITLPKAIELAARESRSASARDCVLSPRRNISAALEMANIAN
jgi:hypothetical protein